jgi:hypothetical protein
MQEDKNESGTLGVAIDRNASDDERNVQLESILDDANDMSRDLLNAGNGFDDLRPSREEEKKKPSKAERWEVRLETAHRIMMSGISLFD